MTRAGPGLEIFVGSALDCVLEALNDIAGVPSAIANMSQETTVARICKLGDYLGAS
jgi:hypothetical protein